MILVTIAITSKEIMKTSEFNALTTILTVIVETDHFGQYLGAERG